MSIKRFIVLGLALAAALPALGQDEPGPIQTGKGHRFVCTDYSQGKVFIVTPEGKAEWDYPASSCNDLWVLPGGNLLFNTGHGVKEVTPEKKLVFNYQSKSEIYASSAWRMATLLLASAMPGGCWKSRRMAAS